MIKNKIKRIFAGTIFTLMVSTTSVQAITHEVQKGDTLYKISKSYGVTLSSLRESNDKWDDLIYPGQSLDIPGETSSTEDKVNTETSVISYTEKEVDLLARLIRAEAENQPFNAKVAVGAVVVNRVKSDKFPNTITSVIHEKNQFTPVSNGMINKAATEETLTAAKDALNGEDPTGGALFFFDTSAKSQWLWSKPQALKVDKMVFAY
jgi:N-acetylmuramoyl-L-alanine amidase